jgi:hypothetical protein
LPKPSVGVPGFLERAPELGARVVQRLVDRATRRSETFREHVGRDFLHGHALKNEPLSLGELLVDRATKRRNQLPLLDGLKRRRRRVGEPIPNRFVDLDLAAPPCEAAKT